MDVKNIFKARSILTGDWLKGGYAEVDLVDGKHKHYIVAIHAKDDGATVNLSEIDSKTLCMSTGLYDKNGILVFENDVLKGEIKKENGYKEKCLKLVSRKDGTFYVSPNRYIGNTLTCFLHEDPTTAEMQGRFEVIANIYDPNYEESGKGRMI